MTAGNLVVGDVRIERVSGASACGSAIVSRPDGAWRILWTIEALPGRPVELAIHPTPHAIYAIVAPRLADDLDAVMHAIFRALEERAPRILEGVKRP